MATIKNNNPGNIRKTSINWQGEIPSTTGFENFSTLAYGYRALISNVYGYITKHGWNTLQKIANNWAPAADGNDPIQYAKTLSKYTGYGVNDPIKWSNQFMFDIAKAISIAEYSTYDGTAILQAIELLKGNKIASSTDVIDSKKKSYY